MLHLGPIPFFTQRTSRAHAQTTHPKIILQLRFISPKITMTDFTSNVTCGLSQFITVLGWKKIVIWLSNNVVIQTFHQEISKNLPKTIQQLLLTWDFPKISYRFPQVFPSFPSIPPSPARAALAPCARAARRPQMSSSAAPAEPMMRRTCSCSWRWMERGGAP